MKLWYMFFLCWRYVSKHKFCIGLIVIELLRINSFQYSFDFVDMQFAAKYVMFLNYTNIHQNNFYNYYKWLFCDEQVPTIIASEFDEIFVLYIFACILNTETLSQLKTYVKISTILKHARLSSIPMYIPHNKSNCL